MPKHRFKNTVERDLYYAFLQNLCIILHEDSLQQKYFKDFFDQMNNPIAINNDNYDKAEKALDELFQYGYFMDEKGNAMGAKTSCGELFAAYLSDKKTQDLNIYVNNQYVRYSVSVGSGFDIAKMFEKGEEKEFTDINRISAYLETKLKDLTADLTSTEKPWSNDSIQYLAARNALVTLRDSFCQPDFLQTAKERLGHPYGIKDLKTDLIPVLETMKAYKEQKGKDKELSSRQIDRLKVMNKIQSLYDTLEMHELRQSRGSEYPLDKIDFETAELENRIALAHFKNMGKELYQFGLTDDRIRRGLKQHTLEFQSIELKDKNAGSKKLTEKYPMRDFEDQKHLLGDELREKKGLNKGIDDKGRQGFTGEEQRILYTLTGKTNAEESYAQFKDMVKNGQIMVFDSRGKAAEPENAVEVLADNIHRPGEKAHFYELGPQNRFGQYPYKAQIIDANKLSEAFAAPEAVVKSADGTILTDDILLFNAVIRDTHQMVLEMTAAASFRHSTPHKELEKELGNMYKKFADFDITKEGREGFAKLFELLNEKAKTYIESRDGHHINTNQIDRLIVAQKISAISDLLKQPDLTYGDYLKNMYAQKAIQDRARRINRVSLDDRLERTDHDQVTAGAVSDAKSEIETELSTYCASAEERALARNSIMKSSEFRAKTDGKNSKELEKLLQESEKETCGALKTVDKAVKKHLPQTEPEVALRNSVQSEPQIRLSQP